MDPGGGDGRGDIPHAVEISGVFVFHLDGYLRSDSTSNC